MLKRYKLKLDHETIKALRHAAIAREATTAAVIETAVVELLMRDGWVRPTTSPSELPSAP